MSQFFDFIMCFLCPIFLIVSKKQIKLSKIFSFFVALGIFCDIIKKKYATDCNKNLGGFAYKTILTTILLSSIEQIMM